MPAYRDYAMVPQGTHGQYRQRTDGRLTNTLLPTVHCARSARGMATVQCECRGYYSAMTVGFVPFWQAIEMKEETVDGSGIACVKGWGLQSWPNACKRDWNHDGATRDRTDYRSSAPELYRQRQPILRGAGKRYILARGDDSRLQRKWCDLDSLPTILRSTLNRYAIVILVVRGSNLHRYRQEPSQCGARRPISWTGRAWVAEFLIALYCR